MDIYKKHLYMTGKPIDREHLVEELGDLFWYIGLGADVLGIALSPEMGTGPGQHNMPVPALMEALAAIGQFRAKAMVVAEIYSNAIQLVNHEKLDYQTILDMNVAKLKKRYGGKFSQEAAINRDVEAEYGALRSAMGGCGGNHEGMMKKQLAKLRCKCETIMINSQLERHCIDCGSIKE
jgi:hypothetical protein